MKGQIVIGAIAMVLVFIIIVGSLYFFIQSTSKTVGETGEREVEETRKETEAAMAISDIYKLPSGKTYVEVKNIGRVNLETEKLNVYFNGSKRTATPIACDTELSPEESCNLSIG